jgi:predicted amino acid racemase
MNKSFDENPMRKKALLSIGKQDTILEDIIPLDSNIKVLGGSSDYTVLDITDCDKNYEVGDIVSFKVRYFSLLRLMNSKYVYKKIV